MPGYKSKKMKILKIFYIPLVLVAINLTSFGQVASLKADSIQMKQKQTEANDNAQNQNTERNMQGVNAQEKGNSLKTIKQVKGARPDMTKARGARPPSIVRPSGSGIPRGAGRPGGAMKRGGR